VKTTPAISYFLLHAFNFSELYLPFAKSCVRISRFSHFLVPLLLHHIPPAAVFDHKSYPTPFHLNLPQWPTKNPTKPPKPKPAPAPTLPAPPPQPAASMPKAPRNPHNPRSARPRNSARNSRRSSPLPRPPRRKNNSK